ncbi:hypothetical protein BJP36_35780 [Moorena producens JHB]|uniref:Uncharacterized protein n=1 Tax=Moorena producens (strain JHB) TaxID=1454205 RepID=A0A9Q9STR2_MOOP1|nr:hypothetical protein [Moorena producens]WAN69452.1 hypothetical protein BJP36_35780 [Moorena producens JHB]
MAKRPRYANNLPTFKLSPLTNLKPSNLKPSNLQPSNLQPSNLQPVTYSHPNMMQTTIKTVESPCNLICKLSPRN